MRPATEAFRAPTMAIAGEVRCRVLAAHGDERRRGVAVAKPGRIERLADADERPAEPERRRHLLLGFGEAGDADGARGAAAPGEVGQRIERRLRRAEMIDEAAKRRWPDILAPDEAQPGKPLLVGQRDAACFDRHVSPLESPAEHGGGRP